MAIQKTYDMVK